MENSNFEFEGFTSFNKKYIFKGKINQDNLVIITSDDDSNDIKKIMLFMKKLIKLH
jgi:hypothetical protein